MPYADPAFFALPTKGHVTLICPLSNKPTVTSWPWCALTYYDPRRSPVLIDTFEAARVGIKPYLLKLFAPAKFEERRNPDTRQAYEVWVRWRDYAQTLAPEAATAALH